MNVWDGLRRLCREQWTRAVRKGEEFVHLALFVVAAVKVDLVIMSMDHTLHL